MDTKVLAAAIIVIVIIIGAALYFGGGKEEQPEAGGEEVTYVEIGALLPLTGDLSTFGQANKEAVLLAQEDVNKYLEEKGYNWRIKITVVDTATDPDTAKNRFDSLYSKGIKFFIGPMSSGELAKIVGLIQQGYEAVVISQSSTAPSLALKDTVYRFPPPDEFQGKVLAKLYQYDGITHVIIVYRNDDWGSGLAQYVEQYFTEAGGTVANKIAYDPKAASFDNVVEQIKNSVEELINSGVPQDKIGVELIAFEEAANILATANQYDVLKSVKWYGSDGTALSQAVVQNKDAASFAVATQWKNTITFSITDKTGTVFCKLKDKLGYTPDPYSLIAYDAVWVMALAIERAGGPDASPQAVAQAIPEVVKDYVGVSGKIVLDENGDRAGSDYGIFEIVEKDGAYEWQITLLYKYLEDQIVPVEGNPLSCG